MTRAMAPQNSERPPQNSESGEATSRHGETLAFRPFMDLSIPAPRLESGADRFRMRLVLSAAASYDPDPGHPCGKRSDVFAGGTWSGSFGSGTVVVRSPPPLPLAFLCIMPRLSSSLRKWKPFLPLGPM